MVNTVLPAADAMLGRGRGAIAIVASLAGYRGQPGAPAYAASKAAVKAWGEGLRPAPGPWRAQNFSRLPGIRAHTDD